MQINPMPIEAKRILIIASGSFSELVFALAAIKPIREYHQDAHIVLFTNEIHERFLAHCPYFDEIVTNWQPKTMGENIDTRLKLEGARFNIVYDLTQNDESDKIYKSFIKKPLWSGVAMGCSHPFIDRSRDKLHLLDRHAEQLRLCGIGKPEGYEYGAAPLPDISWYKNGCDKVFSKAALNIDFDYAILAPEQIIGQRIDGWPTDKYCELAREFDKSGIRPIVVGSPASYDIGNVIRASVPNSIDLIARVDIFGLIELLSDAKMVVGPDGDYTNVSGVIGAPVVSIISSNSGNLRQLAPRGPLTVSLVGRNYADIKVEQILAAAKAVMV